MTSYEDIARQKLTVVERRSEPEPNRFFQGLLYMLALWAAALFGPWVFVMMREWW